MAKKLVKGGQKWLKVVKSGQKWSKEWLKLVKGLADLVKKSGYF